MSDEQVIDGGGPMSGKDGQPSLRRWAGLGCLILTACFSGWGMIALPEIEALTWTALLYFVPAVLFAFLGLLILKLITWQNAQEIIAAAKGK